MNKKSLVSTNDITNNKEMPIPEELTKINAKIAEAVSSIHGDINSETSKTHEHVMAISGKAIDIIHEQLHRPDLTFEQIMQLLAKIENHTNAVVQTDIRQHELHTATSYKLLYILAGVALGAVTTFGSRHIIRKFH